jgi:hypothetical protein
MPQFITQIGISLISLGLCAGFISKEITALLPAFFGLFFVAFGYFYAKQKARKVWESMTWIVAIFGVFVALNRLFTLMATDVSLLGFVSFFGMLLLCLTFIAKSLNRAFVA